MATIKYANYGVGTLLADISPGGTILNPPTESHTPTTSLSVRASSTVVLKFTGTFNYLGPDTPPNGTFTKIEIFNGGSPITITGTSVSEIDPFLSPPLNTAEAFWDEVLNSSDTYIGGNGNDTIVQFGINDDNTDSLIGNDGNDLLILRGKGFAVDNINGGLGVDTFGHAGGSQTVGQFDSIEKIKFFEAPEYEDSGLYINSNLLDFSAEHFGIEVSGSVSGLNIINISPTADDIVDLRAWTFLDWGRPDQKIIIEANNKSGSVKVYGSRVNDSIWGSRKDDILQGGEGNDKIVATNGDDWIVGNAGADNLSGGEGKDSFVLTESGGLRDVIKDFEKGDKIILADFAFQSVGARLKSNEFRIGKAVDKNDFILYDRKTGDLSYDYNGSSKGGTYLVAILDKGLKLTIKDFQVTHDVDLIA